MPSHELRNDLAILAIVGLLANSLSARWVTQPGYTDAYYYFGGAEQIAGGNGLTEPYLWNYLVPRNPADDARQRWPGFLYWMPLTSLVAVPLVAAAESVMPELASRADLFRAAQIPFILVSAGLPLVSYLAAHWVTGRRRPALVAGLLTLFSAFYFNYWTTTDAFALFGLLASGCLLLGALADKYPSWSGRLMVCAGLCSGLAHLTRADGALVVGCLGAWWVVRQWRERTAPQFGAGRLVAATLPLLGLIGAYGLVMLPWLVRNFVTIASPMAPGATRTLWLIDYDDFFTFEPERLTAAAYLASGWRSIVAGKLWALRTNLATLAGAQCGVVGLPLAIAGAWSLRRHPLMQLAALYGMALFVVMTFMFSLPGARGGYFHSGAALLPFIMTAVAVGLEVVVDRLARRLRHWKPERAKPIFASLLVGLEVAIAAGLFVTQVIGRGGTAGGWSQRDAVYAESGTWLAAHAGPDVAVAVNNPPGWFYHTGQAAIVIPSGDVATLTRAMQAVEVEWLVLDANVPAGLADLYGAPAADPGYEVEATFTDASGRAVYVMRRTTAP